jgi:hypothetical protein
MQLPGRTMSVNLHQASNVNPTDNTPQGVQGPNQRSGGTPPADLRVARDDGADRRPDACGVAQPELPDHVDRRQPVPGRAVLGGELAGARVGLEKFIAVAPTAKFFRLQDD